MSRDLLAVKLNSIETLIGAETTPSTQVTDKLGWHLDNIKTAIEAGGTGGGVQKEYVDEGLDKKVAKVTENSALKKMEHKLLTLQPKHQMQTQYRLEMQAVDFKLWRVLHLYKQLINNN